MRLIERLLVRYAFLTNCCVIVEPPWTTFLLRDVLPDGAQDSVQVDAAVLEEALVLDRDDRLLHQRRDLARGTTLRLSDPRSRASTRLPVSRRSAVALLRPLPGLVQLGISPRIPTTKPYANETQQKDPQDEEGEEAELADPATALAVRP